MTQPQISGNGSQMQQQQQQHLSRRRSTAAAIGIPSSPRKYANGGGGGSGKSRRPPSQVFTRGTTGAVKTRHATSSSAKSGSSSGSNHHGGSGGSRSRSSQYRPSSSGGGSHDGSYERRSRQSQPHHRRNGSSVGGNSLLTGRSHGSDSQQSSRSDVDQGSVGSAPVPLLQLNPRYSTSKGSSSNASYELREPQSGSRTVTKSIPEVKKPMREASPSRVQELQKQHIKASRRVVEDLSRAQGIEARIAAITTACEIFDHADEPKHNIELANGAALVLAKILNHVQDDDELRMICSALEMVFRGNTRSVQASYEKINSSLLTTLIRVINRGEGGNLKHADISIVNISKIFLHLSRCSDLRINLCRHQGFLDAVIRTPSRANSADCRISRIRTVANLANCEDNKVLMYEHAGVLEYVVRVALSDTLDLSRQHAGAALMDLASAPANQLSMAADERVLGTLVKMVLVEKSSTTRESVVTALQNLAFAKDNRSQLVRFKSGIVLEALKKALSTDTDAKARRRAAGALTNLACEETAGIIGNHKGLLDTLAIVSTKDDNSEVQTRASLALTKVASSVTVRMACHEAILDALIVASLSSSPNSVSAVLRVKARDPENRERMARHPGLLDTLADICVSSASQVKDRDNAARALMHLVNEDRNRKIMCNKTVLGALVAAASYKDRDLEDARDSAIIAMERLATEVSNRPSMARHPSLLTTIAEAVEREAKWEDSGRESEHGYLAKPLLMTLLVAM